MSTPPPHLLPQPSKNAMLPSNLSQGASMLNLKTLTLENFGPITTKKALYFKPGFNLLLARNGSGKSTSFKAVEMLLADSYQGSYENYINNQKDYFFIELEFEFGGKTYFISLDCKKGKSANTTTRVLQDGDRKDLASGDEAKEFLANLMDKTILKYALIVKQKPEDNIVTCGDSERQLLYKKIKDIDYSREVTLEIEPRIEAVKKEIESLGKEIYSLEHQEYNFQEVQPLPLSEEEFQKSQQELRVLTSKKELQELTRKTYRDKVETQQSLETEITLNTERKTRKEVQISECETRISYLQNSAYQDLSKPLLEKKVGVEAEIQNLDSRKEEEKNVILSRNQESLQNLEINWKQNAETLKSKYEATLAEKKLALNLLKEKLSTLVVQKIKRFDDTLLSQKLQEFAVLNSRQIQLGKEITSFESGVCPTCGGSCTHKLEESRQEQKDLEEKQISLQTEINTLEDEKFQNQKALEANDKNKEEKEKLSSQVEAGENEILTLTTKFETDIRTQETSYQSQVTVLKNQKDLALKDLDSKFSLRGSELKSELDSLSLQIQNLATKIETDLKTEENNKKTLLQDWNEFQIVVQKKTEALQEVKTWIAGNPLVENSDDIEAITNLSQKIKNYTDIQAGNELILRVNAELLEKQKRDQEILSGKNKVKKEKMENQLHLETAKTILLKDFPNFIIDSTIQETEDRMNQFIDDIYYKSLGVELRPTKTSVKLEYGEGDRKIPGFQLSGAESKLVDISFKSYYNSLAELDCLLFDEPDSAMDAENRSKLYEAFLEMGDKVSQIIVVSHSTEMVNYIKNSTETNIITIE